MATEGMARDGKCGRLTPQPPPYLPQETGAAPPHAWSPEEKVASSCRRQVLIGVDPGARGGIAWIDNGRIRCLAMPTETILLWRWFEQWKRDGVNALAVIELVGGYISGAEKKGKNGGAANGARMFKFGQQYGEVLMAMCAAGVRHKLIAPVIWQQSLSLRKTRGEASADHKRRMYADAARRYPTLNVTTNTADAVLICTYLNKVGFTNA